MKKIVLIALALVVVSVLLAQGMHQNKDMDCGNCKKGMMKGHEMQGKKQDGMMMMHVMNQLELTEKQQEDMADLRLKMQKDMISMKAEIETLELDVKVAMKDLDFAKAKKVTSDIFDVKAEMKDKHFDKMISCWNLLTDEQQTEAKELIKKAPMNHKKMMNEDCKGEGKGKNGMHRRMMDNHSDEVQEKSHE
jgi:LTXXQ motif family protein